ncbi:DUF2971 domain-containing protein [uncultured Pontibacter sp.]|uniref:DUF2971 domain-containing protein n=1 Tax=uncultured Pontibacter sp. TaxID=453356 RepID=UPI00261C57B7|nr:DUF2971 domain-containing protein [uncultured Pontibacter sp.]
MSYHSELEEIVTRRLEDSLKGTSLEIRLHDRWEVSKVRRYFDIVIYKNIHPLAVIEVKGTPFLADAIQQLRSALALTNARFGIATDGETFYLYDRNEKDLVFKVVPYDEIISRLTNPEKIRSIEEVKYEIHNIIIQAANAHLQDNSEFISFLNNKGFINKIIFNDASNTYRFYDDITGINSIENQFFNKMFGEFEATQICRYTSLKTIFDMLNFLSFRMSGLVGMNDKSEVNYVDSYLSKDSDMLSVEKPLTKEHHSTITALNKRYITSCSNIERMDDLTLWRLYSDDAKGVCLIFDVKKSNLNQYVLLQKVKYADADGKHKELDFLKNIQKEVESRTGFKFEFRKLSHWKHFFKAHDYKVEEEVRLLIIDNDALDKIKTDWVMTYSHSIFNPIIDFRLNSKSFPIHLSKILLGPKCPEQESNFVQIQEMIRRKKRETEIEGDSLKLDKLKVEFSKIKHYR